MTTDVSTVAAAALAWHDAGCAVLPTRADGTKAPSVAWKPYIQTPPGREQVQAWFADGHPGLGVICGQVSGNLEMLEFEGRAITEGLLQQVADDAVTTGLADLWKQVTIGGYAEWTPSGGLHLLYRVGGIPVPGNTKLARRPATAAELAEHPDDKVKVLAETRGEGGYVVVAPSHGPTHPTGNAWITMYGSPASIPTITADQHAQLHRLIRCHDQMPAPEPAEPRRLTAVPRDDGTVPPGDDFEARTDWADILVPHGWTHVHTRGATRYWRRPGKAHGVSATTGHAGDRDRLYVFTSASDFEPERPYTKFGAHTVLEHGGDHSAAARALRSAGYGSPTPLSPDPAAQAAAIAELVPDRVPQLSVVDGTAVRVIAEPAPAAGKFGPTEDGMARALVVHHGDELRYCPQRGRWLRWDGHRWAWDTAEHHRELIRGLARGLPDGDGWARFKTHVMSARGVSGIERLARSDATLTVAYDRLDADGWTLNTPAGIVDLRTGALHPPDPAALCTRMTVAAPDAAADQSAWRAFLDTTFASDQQLIGYLQRLVGYSAVGVIGQHVLPFAHGGGGNGKGVFLEAMTGVLGDYATSAPVGFLMAQIHAKHETEIARLAGARMVICSEVNEDDRFDEAKVKQLTGGDTLTAHFMRQDHFSFTPTHQLWLMGNHKPAVRSGGRSFWRRLRLIPFLHDVPDDQIIEGLQEKFIAEHGPALMAWIVAGAAAYASGGLREHDSVTAATAEYALDQDTAAQFIDQCCRIGGGEYVKIKMSLVRDAYEKWCAADRQVPANPTSFGLALKRAGVETTRNGRARFYVGLSLVTDDDEESPRNDEGWR